MTNPTKPKYIVVWWNTLKDFHLKPTDLLLVYLINRLTENKHHACYASKYTMAETLNVSLDTIYASLKKLESRGIIYRHHESVNNRRTSPIYMRDGWKEYLDDMKNWDMNHIGE